MLSFEKRCKGKGCKRILQIICVDLCGGSFKKVLKVFKDPKDFKDLRVFIAFRS